MTNTDLHRIPGLHTADGGHSVDGLYSFPMEPDEIVYPQDKGWSVAMVICAIVGGVCGAAAALHFFYPILKGTL